MCIIYIFFDLLHILQVLLVFPGDQSLTLGELKDKLLALNQSIGNEEQHSGSHTCINDVKYSSKCLSEVDENCAASTKCSDSSLNQAAETVVDDDSQKESNRLHSKDQNKETKVLPSSPYHTVVFIDSTWAQTKKIYKDERLQGERDCHIIMIMQDTFFKVSYEPYISHFRPLDLAYTTGLSHIPFTWLPL